MSTLLEALAVAPIARGLAAVLIAGAALPLAGVLVLRLELVTLRFTLMHGALLGAAVALAVGLDPLLPGLAVALLLVVTHVPLARAAGAAAGLRGGLPDGDHHRRRGGGDLPRRGAGAGGVRGTVGAIRSRSAAPT